MTVLVVLGLWLAASACFALGYFTCAMLSGLRGDARHRDVEGRP